MAEGRAAPWQVMQVLPIVRWLPAGVAVLCLVLTAALGAWSIRNNAREARADLAGETEVFAQALSSRIQSYTDTLPGLRVFGVLKTTPTDAEFKRYVEAISLERRFPGLALTFMADLVPREARARYVQAVREDRSLQASGHPEFEIRPPGERPTYMVLRHNHPANAPSFGYDLYDPAQRYREAVDAAVQGGGYVATGPILLARDRGVQGQPQLTSVVIRAAVYAGGQTPDTPAARVQAAQGVVGVSFRTAELVRSALPADMLRDAVIRIVDPQAQSAGQNALLFDSAWLDAVPAPWPVAPADADVRSRPQTQPLRARIRVADRNWDLVVLPRVQGLAIDSTTGWLVALGLALTASLTVMTQVLVQANVSAVRKIREGTAELDLEKTNLERVESRYQTLFMHSRDALMRTVPEGRVLAANPAACALFGCTEAELLAAQRRVLVDESDPRAAELSAMRRATGSAQGQVRLLRADGTPFEAEIATSTYTEPGPEQRVVASVIVRDISERLAMELRLRESQKMESIGTLAGGVAHDFNNVLAVILGNVTLARQATPAGHPAQHNLGLIHQAASRARGLVQQIMTFSRRGPQTQAVEVLQPLVDEALALLRSTLPTTVLLDVQLSEEPLQARMDASQVHQVVMNLCTNAWQALPEAGGRIQVRLDRHAAEGSTGLGLGVHWARLQVLDDGIGMDDATRRRIFEPFFTTKPVGQGTGLGLAVVHGIVTAIGGRIAVDSQPGAGSRFEVLLPLVEAGAAEVRSEPAPPPEGRGQGEHVLYVDDDEVVSITVQALLEAAGYRVTRSAAAPQAIARVQADPKAFDLVISDFNMPVMSGIALARALQTLAPGLPVVITSGHVTDDLRERASQAGVRAVLLKENSFEQLGSIVRAILTQAGQDRQADLSPRS